MLRGNEQGKTAPVNYVVNPAEGKKNRLVPDGSKPVRRERRMIIFILN
jgi:hypothetical protein